MDQVEWYDEVRDPGEEEAGDRPDAVGAGTKGIVCRLVGVAPSANPRVP